jgi:hypothetical protein
MTNDDRAGIVGSMKPPHAGVIVVTLVALAASGVPEPADKPVPHTHAHNDYEHPHPLFDALHQGFVGVEADVYLVGGELRVSHEKKKDWSAVPTREESYLKPLGELKKRRGAGIYADGTRLMLLIDIKTEENPTYLRVHEALASFESTCPGLFTTYRGDGVRRGAVDVVITGNRPREVMKRQALRYAALDGRVSDVGGGSRRRSSRWSATTGTTSSATSRCGTAPARCRRRCARS